jgi:hypothetical protein
MALWARGRRGAEAEAADPRPWGSFLPNRSDGCRHSPEAAHSQPNVSGSRAATSWSGASGMGGRGHVAERRDGAFWRWGGGRMDGVRAGGGASNRTSSKPVFSVRKSRSTFWSET